jgi:hypothetical protein
LLRGWLLHAHKGRDRHDLAARRCETLRYAFGVPAIALSAAVGTSVFATLGQNPAPFVQITVGLLSVASSVLISLQTFLDYAGRAERHRAAAARYKAMIRELEQVLTPETPATLPSAQMAGLRDRLDALEQDMPVVPERIYDRIQDRYESFGFVKTALELSTRR